MREPPLTLGTAGHVDHGKTSLVRALTGVDTDRLAEERARGISIELGYAQLDLPSGRSLSLVDVPGHERFVQTMVAGATGIDLFLLVVDAREGPRAQTVEHLDILRLLGVDRGVVAVTKCDVAEPGQISTALHAVRELLPGAPAMAVSAVSGEGLAGLRAALEQEARGCLPRALGAASRLFVDRVFTLTGIGTVATGTLWSGTIRRGEPLEVMPSGLQVRPRSVQVHGCEVAEAEAGQRVAVALTGIRRSQLRRGDALVEAGAYAPTYRLDVVLDELEPIADGSRVIVNHGTSAIPARLVRATGPYAQLRLQRAAVAARGDRLVLRANVTLAGARVLDPGPRRRVEPERFEPLEGLEGAELLRSVLEEPILRGELRRRALVPHDQFEAAIASLPRADEWLFTPEWMEAERGRRAESSSPPALGPAPWLKSLAPLLNDGREHELPTAAALPAEQLDALEMDAAILENRIAEHGLDPVMIAERLLEQRLEQAGRVVRLGRSGVIHVTAFAGARAVIERECESNGTITLARARDLLGVSRSVAQLILERLDSDHVTLRIGDARRLRRAHNGG